MARRPKSRLSRTIGRVVLALLSCASLRVAAAPGPVVDSASATYDLPIEQAKEAMLGNPARAARLARGAEAAAIAWPPGARRSLAVATTQWLQGEAAFRMNDVPTAQFYIMTALRTVERTAPESKLRADLLLSRARIAVEQGKPQIGLRDIQQAYDLFARLGDVRSEAKALQSIGSIYQDAQDFERVLYYYKEAREILPNDPMLGLSASNNMANAYAQLGHLADAMAEYTRALAIARKLQSALLTAKILANIGDLQIKSREFAASRLNIHDGLVVANGTQAAAERPFLLSTLARLELAEGHVAAAVRAVEAAFADCSDVTTDPSFGPVQLTAYRAYKLSGDYRRALEHLEAFRTLDNAGRTLATSTSSALMTARFDFANQNARIARLKTAQLQADVALAQLEARQRTLLLAGLLILVAGATLFLILYLKSLRRSRNEIVAANLRLAQTNTELAEALLVKSQFLATTSHEIRTPLNGILGMTQVMLADRTVTGELRDRIGLVNSAGRSMRMLVDDILDFAKMDSGMLAIEASAVDIAAVLPDLVSLWRVEAIDKGIALDLDIENSLEPVLTDIVRLRQIIFNLLSNAVKFTTDGAVCVSAARVAGDGTELLVIAFRDSGVGIPATAFETIFEPFRQLDTSTTRRFGGTGLGLAISRHLARALGGDITVHSVPGAGSTFSLHLPYTRIEAGTASTCAAARDSDPDEDGVRSRLLIVGANPIARSILRTRLDPYFNACAACDVDDVVLCIQERRPDLVLIDPDGLGDDQLNALLDRLAGQRDVVVATFGAAAIVDRTSDLLARGVAVVIAKPLSAEALVDALSQLSRHETALLPS